TVKALPSDVGDEGTAVAIYAPGSETNWRPPAARLILVAVHVGSVIDPRCPVVVTADAAVKPAEPKSASGSVWQLATPAHTVGASRIHSAEVVSTWAACSRLVNERCRVRSSSVIVTSLPLTTTVPRTW